jgi:hypothetical protein
LELDNATRGPVDQVNIKPSSEINVQDLNPSKFLILPQSAPGSQQGTATNHVQLAFM